MSTKLDLLREVIESNRELQQKARELNARAGAKLCPVLSQKEWEEWLEERLGGAVSAVTIPDMEALRLPALDENLSRLVFEENPDEIVVLGQAFKVEYREGYAPRLRIDFRGEQAKDWQKLPDEIYLPGGREVVLYSAVKGYGYYIEARFSEFKGKVRERLNQGLWEDWPSADRPAIAVPDPGAEDAVIPDIVSAQYGTCFVTGEVLLGYGAVAYNSSRWSSSDPLFKAEWYRTREEAEAAHAKSVAKLEAIRVEARQKRELAEARTAAEAAREKVRAVSEQYLDKRELSRETRGELSSRARAYLPSELSELRKWTAETEELCSKVGAELAEIEAQVASGQAFVGFEAWHRRRGKSGNGDGWVIRPDGSRRDNDSMEGRHDGMLRWNLVRSRELAIRWRPGSCEVVKLPSGGCTPEQLAAVRAVEEEVGEPEGSFGLDPEAKARFERAGEMLLGILERYYDTCLSCGQGRKWTLEEAEEARKAGLALLCHCEGSDTVTNALDQGAEAVADQTVQVDGRVGTVISRVSMGGVSVVQYAVYHKYGYWNRALVVDRDALAREGEPIFEQVWRQPTEAEIRLAHLKREQESYASRLEHAELAVAHGSMFLLSFRRGKNPKSGAEQWEAEGAVEGTRTKFVLDSRADVEPTRGRFYHCEELRRLVDTGSFKLLLVRISLQAGRDIAAEIAEAEAAIEKEQPVGSKPAGDVPVGQESLEDKIRRLQEKFKKK